MAEYLTSTFLQNLIDFIHWSAVKYLFVRTQTQFIVR